MGELTQFWQDANTITRLVTGKSIMEIAVKVAELSGADIAKLTQQGKLRPEALNDPYVVLGLNPEASTFVVKAVYRALIQQFRQTNDDEQIARINEAFNKIMRDREEPR